MLFTVALKVPSQWSVSAVAMFHMRKANCEVDAQFTDWSAVRGPPVSKMVLASSHTLDDPLRPIGASFVVNMAGKRPEPNS